MAFFVFGSKGKMHLYDYMKLLKIPRHKLAKFLGISESFLHDIIRGKDIRLSLAVHIEKTTCGVVTIRDLNDYRIQIKKPSLNKEDEDDVSDEIKNEKKENKTKKKRGRPSKNKNHLGNSKLSTASNLAEVRQKQFHPVISE